MGEAEEDLEGGGQEESQAGKRERERPLEGDDLGPGSDLLDGVKLGQAGDDEQGDAFRGMMAGEEGEEPNGSQEEGHGADNNNGGGEGVAGQERRLEVVVRSSQVEVQGIDDRFKDISQEEEAGDEDEDVLLFHKSNSILKNVEKSAGSNDLQFGN